MNEQLFPISGLTVIGSTTSGNGHYALPHIPISLRIAAEPLIAMNGSSGSWLVKDLLGKLWVLKARHNNQHRRVTINEFLGTHLARQVGLTVPDTSLMTLSKSSGWSERLLIAGMASNRQETHFASAFIGARWPGKSYERLPAAFPHQIMNASEVAGILALDLWLRNTDSRQAIFVRYKQSNLLQAHWIDFGNCFGAESWDLSGGMKGLLEDKSLYASIHSMAQFLPWVERIQRFDLSSLFDLEHTLPRSWLMSGEASLVKLVRELSDRRRTLIYRIMTFVSENPNIFTSWAGDTPSSIVDATYDKQT